MHVEPISYEDCSFASDIVYELSEKMLLEKVFFIYFWQNLLKK